MDIEKLALECGAFKHAPFGAVEFIFEREELNRFAALVAEACAQIADDMDYSPDSAIGATIRELFKA